MYLLLERRLQRLNDTRQDALERKFPTRRSSRGVEKVPDVFGGGLAQGGEAISKLGAQVLLRFGVKRRPDELEVDLEYLGYQIRRRTKSEQLRLPDHLHGGLKKLASYFPNTI